MNEASFNLLSAVFLEEYQEKLIAEQRELKSKSRGLEGFLRVYAIPAPVVDAEYLFLIKEQKYLIDRHSEVLDKILLKIAQK